MAELKRCAELLGILWSDDDSGCMAYTNNLSIDDFKTYRVNGDLILVEEEEVSNTNNMEEE